MTIEVVVADRVWSFNGSNHYRDGRWVAWAGVPREVRVAITDAERTLRATDRARQIERDHLEALDLDFVVSAYIPRTDPRHFRLDNGEVVDAGLFAIECAIRLGWQLECSAESLYYRVNEMLIAAGQRVREYAPRESTGERATGHSHLPRSLEGAL